MEELFNPEVPVFISVIVLILCTIIDIMLIKYVWTTIKTISKKDENTPKLEPSYYNMAYLKCYGALCIVAFSSFTIHLTALISFVIMGCALSFFYLCIVYLFKYQRKIVDILFDNRKVSNTNIRLIQYIPYAFCILVLGSFFPVVGHFIIFAVTFKKIRSVTSGRCEMCHGTKINRETYYLGLKHKYLERIEKKTTTETDANGYVTETIETTITPIHQAFKMHEDVYVCEECAHIWSFVHEGAMVIQRQGKKKYKKEVR